MAGWQIIGLLLIGLYVFTRSVDWRSMLTPSGPISQPVSTTTTTQWLQPNPSPAMTVTIPELRAGPQPPRPDPAQELELWKLVCQTVKDVDGSTEFLEKWRKQIASDLMPMEPPQNVQTDAKS